MPYGSIRIAGISNIVKTIHQVKPEAGIEVSLRYPIGKWHIRRTVQRQLRTHDDGLFSRTCRSKWISRCWPAKQWASIN